MILLTFLVCVSHVFEVSINFVSLSLEQPKINFKQKLIFRMALERGFQKLIFILQRKKTEPVLNILFIYEI